MVNKNKNRIILFNISSTVILQGITFISGPIFSSILGTNNYGVAAVYLTWVQIASTVFSLQAAGTIAQAKVSFSDEVQIEYQSSVFSLATLAYLGCAGITVIVSMLASRWVNINLAMIITGLLHGWGLYCVTAMNLKFTYEFKADKNFILSVTVTLLNVGLSILLISLFPKDINYWGRIIAQSGVYTVTGIILFAFILRSGRTVYNRTYWMFSLPIAIPTIFHLLAHIVLGQSDKIMLQNMVGNSAAGIYALACTFGAVLQTLYNAFNNSWVPFYYDYTKNKRFDDLKNHARNYRELFTILSMGFILLAREVFHIYANKDFWGGTDLIPLFALGFYFVFLYSFPVNYEFYNKRTKTIALGTSGAALLNIVLNYILIRIWGIQGAVIATASSHGLQFFFHYFCARRINPGEFPFKMADFMPGLFAVCGTCVFYWLTKEMWFIRWAAGAALGIYILPKIVKRKEIF